MRKKEKKTKEAQTNRSLGLSALLLRLYHSTNKIACKDDKVGHFGTFWDIMGHDFIFRAVERDLSRLGVCA